MIHERVLREAWDRIRADLERAHAALGSGSQIIDTDASASGMRCARVVGQIAGLKAALSHIQQAEKDLLGRKK